MYRLSLPDDEGWIFIFSEGSTDDTDEFVKFVKYIKLKTDGRIVSAKDDDIQYRVIGDGYDLIYQWDDCFGITIIIPQGCDRDAAYRFLETCCEDLNTETTEPHCSH